MKKNEVTEYYECQVRELNDSGEVDTASDKVYMERMAELEEKLGAEVCQAISIIANWITCGE